MYIYIVFEDHFVILEAFGNVAKMFCTWFFVRIWFAGSEVPARSVVTSEKMTSIAQTAWLASAVAIF